MNLAESIDRRALESPAPAFLLRTVVWSLALFGLIRLAWVDQHLIAGLVEFQKTVVYWYGAPRNTGLYVNSSCSGADVMALCAGVLLAYPMSWMRRIAGAALGMGLIVVLNAVRIASLHGVASTPATLNLFHLYIWPVILTLATGLYVFAWIRTSERRSIEVSQHWKRFALVATGSLVAFAFAAPWTFTSSFLKEVGHWTAAVGGAVLGAVGAQVQVAGSMLVTSRGTFNVTQECLFTPVLPVYFAAALTYPLSRRARTTWIVAAPLLFFVLGVLRLLVLALPPTIAGAPVMLAHGFYQLMAGAVLIVGASHVAVRRSSAARASGRAILALGAAVVAGMVSARVWEWGLLNAAAGLSALAPWTLTSLTSAGDQQGALALMPSFQVGLLIGLWVALTGGRRWLSLMVALAALAGLEVGVLSAFGAMTAGLGIAPHAIVVRAFAVGVPLGLAVIAWTTSGGTRVGDQSYRKFWHDVGDQFPTLTGAASTRYYFEGEKRLIAEAVPSLSDCSLLKTDLWDEAKNTRILRWVADQGARVYGIDISEPIARQARHGFGDSALSPVVSDVRKLPFADGSFDVIYSMGTIEHFTETEATVAELSRLLRPGGRLILGVPNRHDPFLRPLMVAILYKLGLYAYGYEKSYSRRTLRGMIESAGLKVEMESGLLFMPGWLRMADLWCYTSARPLAAITGALVRPFVWLDRHFPRLRRHGYLLASVGVRPASTSGPAATPRGLDPLCVDDGPRWQASAIPPVPGTVVPTGNEYVIDARECSAELLQSLPRLQQLLADICADLHLQPLAPAVWHAFSGFGGVTGFVLLAESHLTIHTYPESGFAALNLYCCRPESLDWPWEAELRARIGARKVDVRHLDRGGRSTAP